MSSLFLLEDNESLGKSLEQRLGQEGYQVTWAASIEQAKDKIKGASFDIAIIDVSLPDGSGMDFVRSTVRPLGIPTVFLSAFSSAEYRLEGLDAGAVDFIPKPFHLRELLVRVKRVLETKRAEKLMKIGSIVINLESMSITDEKGSISYLPPRDFELFQILIQSSPKALSREDIIKKVWGDESSGNARTVDNAIVRLRQSLGEEASRCIRSVRGIGYQWVQDK